MSRIRKAAVAASFGYIQYGVAILSALVLVPVTLQHLGARTYGLWLASAEVLGYAAMVDLGVLGVMPWMLAEADGRGDRNRMRALMANGIVVGVVVGVGYGLVAALLWTTLPSVLRLTATDRAAVSGPLAILVLTTMAAYPLRVFSAVVAGLQDVKFAGALSITQTVLSFSLTVWLLSAGYGLTALAVASSLSLALAAAAAFVRTALVAPDLLTGWPRPTLDRVRHLLTNGVGAWFGAFGWQLMAASNSLVITFLGHPEWVPIYVCTAKLSSMVTQLVWVVPDAGLIGLAQLHGERRPVERLRTVVMMLLRVHLLLGGAATCGLLAFNPAFVSRWVGAQYFGGLALSTLLALGAVVYSFNHGLLTAASVLGNRLRVGTLTFANGVLQVVSAITLGMLWGLPGIAAGGLFIGVAASIPVAVALLRPSTSLSFGPLWVDVVKPWLHRAAPIAAAAAIGGSLYRVLGTWGAATVSAGLSATYFWYMRPLYAGLPLDPRWSRWLTALRLLPPAAPPLVAAEPPGTWSTGRS